MAIDLKQLDRLISGNAHPRIVKALSDRSREILAALDGNDLMDVLNEVSGAVEDVEAIVKEKEGEIEGPKEDVDAAKSALESAEEDVVSAQRDASAHLSGEACPFCGSDLLAGEAIHDCRTCRAQRVAEIEFHARNPAVRAKAGK